MSLDRYKAILEKNNIILNPAQVKVLEALSHLAEAIANEKRSLLSSIISIKPEVTKGVYVYGSVGTGKSMLGDIFFENIDIKKKQKIHFHSFMKEIHDYMHNSKISNSQDPLKNVAKFIASRAKVLYIDEFDIEDIADAMIVGKLFRELFELKVIILTTSNKEPDELYKDGLQRDSFVPFIDLIKEKMQILKMDHIYDFRKHKLSKVESSYFIYEEEMDAQRFAFDSFLKITDDATPHNKLLNIDGREFLCSMTAQECVILSFDQLCRAPMASNDYIAIAQEFDVIILIGIPKLSSDEHNEAKRFINLIDIIYDLHKVLICAAKTEIDSIYEQGKWHREFKRTESRLHEMQSKEYINKTIKKIL